MCVVFSRLRPTVFVANNTDDMHERLHKKRQCQDAIDLLFFFLDPSLSGLWAPLLALKHLTISASWANDWSISNNYWVYKLQNIGRNKKPWCGGRDVWKWMRLDPKKQSRERAENKVIYNLLSVTKGNQITTHYSRPPRKKKKPWS